MPQAVFTDVLPAVRIENGLVFMAVAADHAEVCCPVSLFEQFLEVGRREVVVWHGRQAPVVPFRKP